MALGARMSPNIADTSECARSQYQRKPHPQESPGVPFVQSRSQRLRSFWSATGQRRCEVARFRVGIPKIRKRNTESNINDRKLKNFTLRNLVQSKENLF